MDIHVWDLVGINDISWVLLVHRCQQAVHPQDNILPLWPPLHLNTFSKFNNFRSVFRWLILYRVVQEEIYYRSSREKKIIWQVSLSESLLKQLFWVSIANYIRYFFVGLDEMRRLQKKGGYNRRIAVWHFGCCWLHNETSRSAQTNNTRSSFMSCEVHWGWQWDFGKIVVNWNKICHLYIKFELKKTMKSK